MILEKTLEKFARVVQSFPKKTCHGEVPQNSGSSSESAGKTRKFSSGTSLAAKSRVEIQGFFCHFYGEIFYLEKLSPKES